MYKFLNSYEELKGRIRIIECPTGYDASDIYREFKEKGVAELLRTAKKIDEFDLLNIK